MSTPELLYINNDQFIADVRTLAATLGAGDWHPDFIVGIGRGGLVPAVFLSHATGLALPTFGDELLEKLAAKTRTGTRLLIVDDINDSGRTLAYLRCKFLEAEGVADNLRIAVLIDNIRSIESVDYRARTIDREQEKRWFVFPWEAMAEREEMLVQAAVVHNAG
jgi:uncharacterized protein